jgi:hypothetical protein
MRLQDHAFFNNGRFKVFIVELDDDNRERVISAVATRGSVEIESEQGTVQDFYGMNISTWDYPIGAKIELNIVRAEDGSLFKYEDFSVEYEEDEE